MADWGVRVKSRVMPPKIVRLLCNYIYRGVHVYHALKLGFRVRVRIRVRVRVRVRVTVWVRVE